MIPSKRRDAPGGGGYQKEDKPQGGQGLPPEVEPEKKEDDMTEEKEGGEREDRDELT